MLAQAERVSPPPESSLEISGILTVFGGSLPLVSYQLVTATYFYIITHTKLSKPRTRRFLLRFFIKASAW